MSSDIQSAIIGAIIGIAGSLSTTLVIHFFEYYRHKHSITAVVIGEIVAIREKSQRYIAGESSFDEFKASSPMLVTIAHELGYLSPVQAVAMRRAVTIDMEMRQTGNIEKAEKCIDICDDALRMFKFRKK